MERAYAVLENIGATSLPVDATDIHSITTLAEEEMLQQ
jgi:hypothetical protein